MNEADRNLLEKIHRSRRPLRYTMIQREEQPSLERLITVGLVKYDRKRGGYVVVPRRLRRGRA